ncbi:hypothetical protein U1Q18_007671 [Sarracenia purpurea var. burkii]
MLRPRTIVQAMSLARLQEETIDAISKENKIAPKPFSQPPLPQKPLELLTTFPCCLSIERKFVNGGGQIFREAINAPGCDAIHVTEIEASIKCETFIPSVDTSLFQPWYSSLSLMESSIHYSFTTYVRVMNATFEIHSQANGLKFDCFSGFAKLEVKKFSFLPKMIFEKHEEHTYLRLLQDIISNGTPKDDRTGIEGVQKNFEDKGGNTIHAQLVDFDLLEEAPDAVLHRLYLNLERLKLNGDEFATKIQGRVRIIVAGGEGTAGWLLGVVFDFKVPQPPPMATVLLGTGNNLLFSFGLGKEESCNISSFCRIIMGTRNGSQRKENKQLAHYHEDESSKSRFLRSNCSS